MTLYVVVALVVCGSLVGCYQLGPPEEEVRTVPVTNNPHAMPGSIKSSPLPSIF